MHNIQNLDFNIGFTSRVYTVSEDDNFIDLAIIKTPVNDVVSTTGNNITIFFYTEDGTAQGINYYINGMFILHSN